MANNRLFVGGLPYSTDDAQLSELFAKFGSVVSSKVIVDKFSGKSKGFGFVEFATDEEAQAAIAGLNETELEGRKITVNVAKPMEERSPYQNNRGGGNDRRQFRNDRRW